MTSGGSNGDHPDEIDGSPSRRSILAKAGVGLAVAWVAPTIISKPAFAAGSCFADAVDWTTYAASLNNNAPSPFNPFSINVGMAAQLFMSSNAPGAGTATYAVTTPLGGLNGGFIELSIVPTSSTDFVEVTFAFDTPINFLTFTVIDIDRNPTFWQDQVTLTATLAGNPVSAAIGALPGTITHTANPTNDVLDATSGPQVGNNTTNGDVAVSYGIIDTLVVRFGPGNGTDFQTHQIGIGGFNFCVFG